MKAVTCTGGAFAVTTTSYPPLSRRRVSCCSPCCVAASAARICTRATTAIGTLADVTSEMGYDGIFRSADTVVLGHEFCGEVVDSQRGAKLATGTRVVSFPLLRRGKDVHPTGLSVAAPGGYAEQVLVEQSLTFAVPNGLSTELATLTEPMAVGLHAVRRSEDHEGPGRGRHRLRPRGLGRDLHAQGARGVRTVIASDLSPGRRALASACGAGRGRRPGTRLAVRHRGQARTPRPRALRSSSSRSSTMEKLRRIPFIGWERVWPRPTPTRSAPPPRTTRSSSSASGCRA